MKRNVWAWVVCGVLLGLAGCAKRTAQAPGTAVTGENDKDGAYLAYEHAVSIRLSAAAGVPAQLARIEEACDAAKFGACSVLRVEQYADDDASALVALRIVPAGVEPMMALAGQGGTLGSRVTKADDLADAVADAARKRALLQAQRARLEAFQQRKDLAAADLIAIAHDAASIDVDLDALDQTASDQRRRLETNLLTVKFAVDRHVSAWSRVANAFTDLGDNLAEGVEEVIGMAAYGLPFLLLAFPLALLWRWGWRRVTRIRAA